MAPSVRRHGCARCEVAVRAGSGERQAEEAAGRSDAGRGRVGVVARGNSEPAGGPRRGCCHAGEDESLRTPCVCFDLPVAHGAALPGAANGRHAARRLIELASERRRFGYRHLHTSLEREGFEANHKRVHRLYRLAGLAVRRRRKRDRVAMERRPLQVPPGPTIPGRWTSSSMHLRIADRSSA